MRTVPEIQRRLIELGFLAVGEDDGTFGQKSLDALNHFLASKGKPEHTGMILLTELNALLFPEDAPPPKPKKRNTVFGELLKTIIINQIKGQIPMLGFLDGYKTYIVAAVSIVLGALALIGWSIPGVPPIPPAEGWQLILTGLAALGMRRAITTGK